MRKISEGWRGCGVYREWLFRGPPAAHLGEPTKLLWPLMMEQCVHSAFDELVQSIEQAERWGCRQWGLYRSGYPPKGFLRGLLIIFTCA